ncbi:carboxypeptidase-like regulatory domain-containing protein [Acidicapsa ligni]|uniref:carboxypeptidase-like regulatory domain-containing protein n=1 Tax=Acidicapsa ligni TaxID=542300 RepID=UPI0021E0D625|nr:carboxypeptidase-like regulatory domain-containing protein [Acidicapsa ligni]
MRLFSSRIFFFFVLAFSSGLVFAQTTATVNGTVTDSSNALIPGATVVLSNPSTGVRYEVKTDSAGSYRLANVPPGPGYTIEFNAQGFAALKVNNIYVNVANSRTQNAKLQPGVTVEVQVSDSAGVTLNTTDASIGNNFEVSKLEDLPVQDRTSPSVLFTLQPGITSSGATTGARTDQTNTTIDGLDVNDFATGNFAAITGNAPVDSIQEFRGTTAGFTADNGPGGGGQFQLVTRGGTNEWHGNINEYHRDNSTTANDWFDANAGVSQPELVRNQFGGAVGGPIKHDKIFFFFNFLGSRIAQQETVERTVPLPSFAAGNISYINNNAGCTDAARQNTSGNCISSINAAQVQQIDPAHIGESPQVFALFASRYPKVNDPTFADGVNSAGFRFNSAIPTNLTNYTGRIDWTLTPKIKIYGIGNVARENQVDGAAQFPGDPPSSQFVDRSYRYAAGMDWQISDSKVNQFTYGSVVQDYGFPRPSNPEGIYQISFGNGFTPSLADSPYASPSNAQSRHTIISQVNDNFIWTKGRHQLEVGGYFKWIHNSSSSVLGYNSYGIGLGGHIFSTPDLEPANLLPGDSVAAEYYDNAFVSSLGRVASISSTFNYDASGNVLAQPSSALRKYVYYQTQPYISDSWKVTPHLTVNVGLNYQYLTVPYETQGLETVQTTGFDQYFSAREKQSAAGISGNTAVPFITYVLGGKKNHGPSFYAANTHDFAPHVAFSYNPGFDPSTVFNGSAGVVYDRTVVNAVQYQQTQFSYLFEQNTTVNNGNNSDADGSIATDPRLAAPPLAVAPATPKAPFQPWVTNNQPNGLINGLFNEMIDPHLKTPYSILVNFGVQHQFQGSTILKVSYVGRFGRRLLAQADGSQLIDFPDTASGQTMNQAMVNIEREVRGGADVKNLPAEPWFEHQLPSGYKQGMANNTSAAAAANSSLVSKGDFADFIQALSPNLQPNVGMAAQFGENTVYTNKGFSSYHGLLVTLQKNLTHGLQFEVNYTWSHSIDNVSLVANGVAYGGYGFVCDAVHPRECRGNSDFDTAHYITSDLTYSLPFGRGRSFGAHLPWALDEVIGGWDLSAIPSWHSGQAWSALSNAFVAGFANDAPAIFNGDTNAVRRHIHKDTGGTLTVFADPAAAAAAFSGPVGLAIGSRNSLRGPQFFNVDAGVAKYFKLLPSKDVGLQFRADAFNVFNHPNFDDLDYGTYSAYTNITAPSNFGQLTAMNGAPRVLQLSARIRF